MRSQLTTLLTVGFLSVGTSGALALSGADFGLSSIRRPRQLRRIPTRNASRIDSPGVSATGVNPPGANPPSCQPHRWHFPKPHNSVRG